MDWQNKKVLVVGLGGTGVSMIAFLRQQGAQVAAYDAVLKPERETELKQRFNGLHCYTGDLSTALSHGFDVLALSPGVSVRQAAIEQFQQGGGRVLGDIEILALELRGKHDKIIAITGSNGKTTVTSLVGHLCQQSGLDTIIAGNIGTPVLEAYMQRGGKSADVWVLELSSFQLETTDSLQAHAAAVLNISEDHLERYHDLLDYAYAKTKIFQGKGVQVLNADDVMCRAMKRQGRTIQWFSLNQASDYWADLTTGELKAGEHVLLPFHYKAYTMQRMYWRHWHCVSLSVWRVKRSCNTCKPFKACHIVWKKLARKTALPLLTTVKALMWEQHVLH